MKKRDFFVAAVVIAAAIFIAMINFFNTKEGNLLRITVDGEVYGTYELGKTQEILIGETNVAQIEEGHAWMSWADCPDQICVRTAKITEEGQTIVCLPNRIVLEVISEGE